MAVVEQAQQVTGVRRQLRLANPATLTSLGAIDVCTETDVRAALERARKAQREWAALSFDERGRYLERAAKALVEHQDEFLDVLLRETGKPLAEAIASEILIACDALQFYAKRAKRVLADRTVPVHLLKTKKLRIQYAPLGVVGIITPWNFPFLLSLNPTIQALVAGNAVLLKPSEATPQSGALVGELFERVGLPEGLLSVLPGDGDTGRALVEAGVDKISFTGSVRSGRKVAEACARQLIPCTLELGGKDPMIVCEDADLERAARGAVFGAFANAGQVCASIERVFVVDEVADEFTRKVVHEAAALRQGAEGEFDVGAIIRSEQLEVIDRHVQDAVGAGARLLAGGRRNPEYDGLFYEPTVLADVTPEMDVMREETFGPVLPIMRVRDVEEAILLANDSPYGLNASVWTKDKRRGGEIASRLETGCVVINDCMVTYGIPESPFGGVKDSGIGRVNGEAGLRGYCHERSIVSDRFGMKREPNWYPHTERKVRIFKRVVRVLWGTSLGRFLS